MVDFTPVRQSVAIRVLVVAVGKVIAELVHVEEAVAIGVDGRSLVTAQGRSWATKCDETVLEFVEKGHGSTNCQLSPCCLPVLTGEADRANTSVLR